MPEEAQLELGRATVDGFNIAAFAETQEDFEKRLADREAQVSEKPDQHGGGRNLESEIQVKSEHGLVGLLVGEHGDGTECPKSTFFVQNGCGKKK